MTPAQVQLQAEVRERREALTPKKVRALIDVKLEMTK